MVMNYSLNGSFDPLLAGLGAGAAASAILLIMFLYLAFLAFGVACYVLSSLGMYTIAKRRGLRLYGMAWVPVGDCWLLGSIGDHYVRTAKGKKSSLRIWLLVLSIVTIVLTWVATILMALAAIFLRVDSSDPTGVTLGGICVLLFALLTILVIALAVLEYISYYRLYKSSRPDKATLFIVLSVLFTVTIPFFVFACRKYDDGLTPPEGTAELVEAEIVPTPPQES